VLVLCREKRQILRSTDGFRTWGEINTDSISTFYGIVDEVFDAQFVQLGHKILFVFESMYYGTYCSFYSYSEDDGLTWHRGNGGRGAGFNVNNMASFGDHLVLAHPQGIFHSKDALKTSFSGQIGLSLATPIYALTVREGTIWVETNRSVYKSANFGKSWDEGIPDPQKQYCGEIPRLLNSQQWIIIMNNGGQDFYSEDGGTSWTLFEGYNHSKAVSDNCLWLLSVGTLRKICDGSPAFEYLTAPELEGKILGRFFALGIYFAITVSSTEPNGDKGSFLVFNEVSQFVREAPPSPCPLYFPTNSFFYFDGKNILQYCGPNTYIFKENATAWEEIYPQDWTTGIPLYHNRITDIKTHDGVTWVALEGKGLFYTTDASGRFYPAQPQLPHPYPTAISFRDNEMWVGTEGGGLYHTAWRPVQPNAAAKPSFQCSPNPSDGRLHLEADAFLTTETALEVLDVTGKTAASALLSPGQTWDLDFPQLPQAAYVLLLRTEAGSVALKWFRR